MTSQEENLNHSPCSGLDNSPLLQQPQLHLRRKNSKLRGWTQQKKRGAATESATENLFFPLSLRRGSAAAPGSGAFRSSSLLLAARGLAWEERVSPTNQPSSSSLKGIHSHIFFSSLLFCLLYITDSREKTQKYTRKKIVKHKSE